MEAFPLAFAAVIGFGHAFEADHLLAVSTLVSKSKTHKQVLHNGFIWGLGHSSTILLMGVLLILFQVNTLKAYFDYFEIFVGLMLIALGILRLVRNKETARAYHSHDGEAYSIGLIHGLAGSGALILLVMTDLESSWEALGYLLLFGVGSAIGMSVAAAILRIPLLQGRMAEERKKIFSWLASGLCILYGVHILFRFI